MRPGERRRAGGYMLLMLLIAVAATAAAATIIVTRWSDELRREQEHELLRVGDTIAGAIASYRRASAGSAMKHPPELDDLLEDRRAFGTSRHLRRLYADPTTRGAAWGVIRADDGGVLGVYSRNDAQPFRRTAVKLRHVDLEPASGYSQWRFVPRGDVR